MESLSRTISNGKITIRQWKLSDTLAKIMDGSKSEPARKIKRDIGYAEFAMDWGRILLNGSSCHPRRICMQALDGAQGLRGSGTHQT